MYSQNSEEKIILDAFKDLLNGRFLDIGAFDPFLLSNTRALYEMGWKGVFVEPGKEQLKKFYAEYSNDDKIQICENAIANVAGELTFYITPTDALSTLSEEHLKKWHTVKFDISTIEAITPRMLFDKYGTDFHFIDLDIEGNNWEILQLIPFSELKSLRLICIEYDNNYNDIISFMKPFGFSEIHKNGENVILIRK